MSNKVFDKKEIDKMSRFQLQKEKSETTKELNKQKNLFERFGPTDKYKEARSKHISLLYKKRKYIGSKLKELKENKND